MIDSRDSMWEDQFAYLAKRFFETSLDGLLERQHEYGAGKDNEVFCSRFLTEIVPDSEEALLGQEQIEKKMELISEIYSLLSDREFFTERQKEVLSLLFGWDEGNYVGPKTVSDIAKILGIAQPVAFNHLRLAIRKLKKHFKTSTSSKE